LSTQKQRKTREYARIQVPTSNMAQSTITNSEKTVKKRVLYNDRRKTTETNTKCMFSSLFLIILKFPLAPNFSIQQVASSIEVRFDSMKEYVSNSRKCFIRKKIVRKMIGKKILKKKIQIMMKNLKLRQPQKVIYSFS
jgi:hypothetical protein